MTAPAPRGTPYRVLDVAPDATAVQLRRAYRRRMRQTHPDLGGDPADFAAVQHAWEQVGTAKARAAYDRSRANGEPSRHRPRPDPGPKVWTSGPTTTQAPARSRSHGHPGGWSRERYLSLLTEWVGRGVTLPDPYDEGLVRRAPVEIRHALADALAEEATARDLSLLGPGFTVWHDVATEAGSQDWSADASAGASDPAKIDHIVLGPTGLFVVQSEDWGAPVQVQGKDLVSPGLPPGAKPMHALAKRAKIARRWRVAVSALVIVLPDDAIAEPRTVLRRSRTPRLVIQRGVLGDLLRSGFPAGHGLSVDDMFNIRTRLLERIQFV